MTRTQFSLSPANPTYYTSLGFDAVALVIINYTPSEVYVRVGDNLAAGPTSYHYIVPAGLCLPVPVNNTRALSLALSSTPAGATLTALTNRVDCIAVDASEPIPNFGASVLFHQLGQYWHIDALAPGATESFVLDVRRGRGLTVSAQLEQGSTPDLALTLFAGETPTGPWRASRNLRFPPQLNGQVARVAVPVLSAYCLLMVRNYAQVGNGICTIYYDVQPDSVGQHITPTRVSVGNSLSGVANGDGQGLNYPVPGAGRLEDVTLELIGLPGEPWRATVYGGRSYVLASGGDPTAWLAINPYFNGSQMLVLPSDDLCVCNQANRKVYRLPMGVESDLVLPSVSVTYTCASGTFGLARLVGNWEVWQ
jgi:hypothetical protein